MSEQTLETQLQESVAKYTESGNQIHKFTNGTAEETVTTDAGEVSTLAKIEKDTQDTISASMTDLTTKSEQVATDKTEVSDLKDQTQQIVTDFESTHKAALESAISANSLDISANAQNIAEKAAKIAEPIAYVEFGKDGTIINSKGVKMVTRTSTGIYKIYLNDELKGKEFNALASTTSWSTTRYASKNFEEGSVVIQVITFQGDRYIDSVSTAYIYER
ncbi:MAG TPA: hypothetical protein DCL21_01480 [Alphaproteobacteria bacterium]|nr:hypothetical protein [Alphaproteobacteria bacterium]